MLVVGEGGYAFAGCENLKLRGYGGHNKGHKQSERLIKVGVALCISLQKIN